MAEKGKPCSEVYNITYNLQSREIGNRLILRNVHSQIMFRDFQLQKELDTNEPSNIVQIGISPGIIVVLAQSGLCTAFDRDTNKILCCLNLNRHDQIKRLFYMEKDNSVIALSARASHGFSIKCRKIPLDYIRNDQPNVGFDLFEGENLTFPGIAGFDSLNAKAVISVHGHIFKVFDLKNCRLLYTIAEKEIENIRIASDIMLLVLKRSACGNFLPLKILAMEDNTVLRSFRHAIVPNKKVDLVKLIHDKILVKQEDEYLQIIDVLSGNTIQLSKPWFKKTPPCFFLYKKQLFLTVHVETVRVWNLQGEVVASYRNRFLRSPGTLCHFTRDEELLLSYNKLSQPSINIVDILTGNCYAEIGGDQDVRLRNAFEDITTLVYDEERNEIYTGNARGIVHVWSN